jgi:hypothetical protein
LDGGARNGWAIALKLPISIYKKCSSISFPGRLPGKVSIGKILSELGSWFKGQKQAQEDQKYGPVFRFDHKVKKSCLTCGLILLRERALSLSYWL